MVATSLTRTAWAMEVEKKEIIRKASMPTAVRRNQGKLGDSAAFSRAGCEAGGVQGRGKSPGSVSAARTTPLEIISRRDSLIKVRCCLRCVVMTTPVLSLCDGYVIRRGRSNLRFEPASPDAARHRPPP